VERPDLSYVGRDEVADELFHVVVDGASFLDGGDDRREVVVGEHHLRGGLGDRRARAHRDADLGLLQRRRVVDTIPGLYGQNNAELQTNQWNIENLRKGSSTLVIFKLLLLSHHTIVWLGYLVYFGVTNFW